MSNHETAVACIDHAKPTLPIAAVSDLQIVGNAIAQSGMFGSNNPGAGLVVAATCHSQGISLVEFIRTYHIVNGKPSMRADAMLAEFRKRGGKYAIIENSVNRAAAKFTFEGQEYNGEFSMEDAKRTGDCFDKGQLKHNWQHRPEDMLWARMVSRAVRRLCPEIVAGLYTPEEVQDFSPAREPKPAQAISVQEANARASGTAAYSIESDFEVCPVEDIDVGGERWERVPDVILKAFCETYWTDPRMTDGHRAALAAEVERRKSKA